MISLEKWMILTPLQKLPNNVGDLGKIIVATGFEWLPKSAKYRPIWSHWYHITHCPPLPWYTLSTMRGDNFYLLYQGNHYNCST